MAPTKKASGVGTNTQVDASGDDQGIETEGSINQPAGDTDSAAQDGDANAGTSSGESEADPDDLAIDTEGSIDQPIDEADSSDQDSDAKAETSSGESEADPDDLAIDTEGSIDQPVSDADTPEQDGDTKTKTPKDDPDSLEIDADGSIETHTEKAEPESPGTESTEKETAPEPDADAVKSDAPATRDPKRKAEDSRPAEDAGKPKKTAAPEPPSRFYAVADVRAGLFYFDDESDDGSNETGDGFGARYRLAGTAILRPNLRATARLAGLSTTDKAGANFALTADIGDSSSIDQGDLTLDELFLHFYSANGRNVAIGRLQTKFVTRAGVFSKSLDRNDSSGTNVNWTDGIQASRRFQGGWNGNVVVQYNSKSGASNARHSPLDFADSGSRASLFLAAENLEKWGPIVQRAIDISFLPESLAFDGLGSERREDYWGIVARTAAAWPIGENNRRLRVASEVGYAPQTPRWRAVDLPGRGDADGLAWNASASVMNVMPRHSIGVNYGHTDAGWLLSPQYRSNERLFEVRYQYNRAQNRTLEIRARWRDQIDAETGSRGKKNDFDVYIRLTLRTDRIYLGGD